ncbi:T-complex protein 1 subunit theta [Babesia microti strain RI]|uniref:CCT-theta n=1 Tax=Babesia microti (strain RI) TaxID=1133968 RepID=A0A1R4ABF1_BABMR|nr:T-complex protein 1 subunit theta [Babesia microti strain RI]SJK86353.1 T-complex protein 1 subunit theta [Babesia microti strain RI]|eukprot:XP_021338520.1 T-complex protein 1 subunit theta [Babesia microti strain RI]
MFAQRLGARAIMRDGSRIFGQSDSTLTRNIEACNTIATMLKTCLGPNSMNKLIVNHINKRFVTSDAITILEQLEVQHPAAKILVIAAQALHSEFGDGVNFLVIFAGELLNNAGFLIDQGLHLNDVIKGYEMAHEKCLELMSELVAYTCKDLHSNIQLQLAIKGAVCSRQNALIAGVDKLVAEAASMIMPRDPKLFDIDSIRVSKIVGGSTETSFVINGMALLQDTSGSVKSCKNTKVLVLGTGFETHTTEAKGTVLFTNAEELLNYSKGEDDQLEKIVKGIKDLDVGCIIVNGSVSEMAIHFANKYQILVIKVVSKFDARRLCRLLGATALARMEIPTKDDLGSVSSIDVIEMSSQKVTIINATDNRVVSIILKGATMNVLDELERAIDDGICCIKSMTKDARFLAGAGSTEMELSVQLTNWAKQLSGMEKHSALKFAEALQIIPNTLAANEGFNAADVVTLLYASHVKGNKFACVNVSSSNSECLSDATELSIYDHYNMKMYAIKLAFEAVITVLGIDQVIMAKPAGGPKPRDPGPPDLD